MGKSERAVKPNKHFNSLKKKPLKNIYVPNIETITSDGYRPMAVMI